MNREQVVTDRRLSGQVQRYHTWPTIQKQSTGEHTWQVIRLYWEMYDEVLPGVLAYLLWHDSPELVTGDLPFPSKSKNPQLKGIMDDMEDEALTGLIGPTRQQEVLGGVTELERMRMKACDLLDMYEFGMQELTMGNRFGEPIVQDTRVAILALVERMPQSERSIITRRIGA